MKLQVYLVLAVTGYAAQAVKKTTTTSTTTVKSVKQEVKKEGAKPVAPKKPVQPSKPAPSKKQDKKNVANKRTKKAIVDSSGAANAVNDKTKTSTPCVGSKQTNSAKITTSSCSAKATNSAKKLKKKSKKNGGSPAATTSVVVKGVASDKGHEQKADKGPETGNKLIFNPPPDPKLTSSASQLSPMDATLFNIIPILGMLVGVLMVLYGTAKFSLLFMQITNSVTAFTASSILLFVIISNQNFLNLSFGFYFLVSGLVGLVFAGLANTFECMIGFFSMGSMLGFTAASIILAISSSSFSSNWLTILVNLGCFGGFGIGVLMLVPHKAHLYSGIVGGYFLMLACLDSYVNTSFAVFGRAGLGLEFGSRYSDFRLTCLLMVAIYLGLVGGTLFYLTVKPQQKQPVVQRPVPKVKFNDKYAQL